MVSVFRPGDHGSTFGGSPLGAAVALAALTELETEGLAERSAKMGERLRAGLRDLRHPRLHDIRGRGLLVGLEVTAGTDTHALVEAFLAEGLLTKETRSRTFRLAPPLIIDVATVDQIVRRVGRALGRLPCGC